MSFLGVILSVFSLAAVVGLAVYLVAERISR